MHETERIVGRPWRAFVDNEASWKEVAGYVSPAKRWSVMLANLWNRAWKRTQNSAVRPWGWNKGRKVNYTPRVVTYNAWPFIVSYHFEPSRLDRNFSIESRNWNWIYVQILWQIRFFFFFLTKLWLAFSYIVCARMGKEFVFEL